MVDFDGFSIHKQEPAGIAFRDVLFLMVFSLVVVIFLLTFLINPSRSPTRSPSGPRS